MYEKILQASESVRKKKDAKQETVTLFVERGDKSGPLVLNDGEEHQYILLTKELMDELLGNMRAISDINIKLELERDITSAMPIDFNDVASIAHEMVGSMRRSDGSLPKHFDTMEVVEKIRASHPNLFYYSDAKSQRTAGLKRAHISFIKDRK